MEYTNPQAPPPSRTGRIVIYVIGAVVGLTLVCVASAIAYVVIKGPAFSRQAQGAMADWTRMSASIGARFGVPCTLGERTFHSSSGTSSTLNVVYTNVADERLGGRSRDAFAREVAAYARSVVAPGTQYTQVCVVFTSAGSAGFVNVRRTDPHCTAWSALEVVDAGTSQQGNYDE